VRIFWLHVRNSPVRWTVPVLVALDLAILFLRTQYWVGVWPETGAAAQVPAYLLGVLVAGAAAWAAAAPVRRGMQEQLSVAKVHPAGVDGYRLAATTAILTVPYLIGQMVAFAVTARTFPPGVLLWFAYALLGLSVTFLSVSLGWLLGRFFGGGFGAMTAALGWLFVLALTNFLTGDFVVVTGRPYLAVDAFTLAVRFGCLVLMAVALLWLPESGRRSRWPGQGLVSVASAAALMMLAVVTPPVTNRPVPEGEGRICISGRTTLCIWQEQEKYRPLMATLSGRIDGLPTAFTPPPEVREFGLDARHGLDERLGVSPPHFYILEGSPWSYGGMISTEIMSSTFAWRDPACDWGRMSDADQLRSDAVLAWLEAYLVGDVTPDYSTDAPSAMQQAWASGRRVAAERPLPEQFDWAAGEVISIRGEYCAKR